MSSWFASVIQLGALLAVSHCTAVAFAAPQLSLMDTPITEFSCTNKPVSEVIHLVAKKVSFPINAVMDIEQEPLVSISGSPSTVGSILADAIRPLTNYAVIVNRDTLLVCPKDLVKDVDFPLNKVLPAFEVFYQEFDEPKGKIFRCEFQWEIAASLNVAMPPLYFKNRPNFESFPAVRTYRNQSLLGILTEVSSQLGKSWSCGRIKPGFVREQNRDWAARRVGTTWWPNEMVACYSILWEQGAYHGTDVEEEQKRASKKMENMVRFRKVNQAMKRGAKNANGGQLQVQAKIITEPTKGEENFGLLLSVTNASKLAVSFLNPFLGDLEKGFWTVRIPCVENGVYREYELQLTVPSGWQESKTIVLPPEAVREWTVSILGAPVTLDEISSDLDLRAPILERLDKPGKYEISVRLFYQDQNKSAYFLFAPPIEFEVNGRMNQIKKPK